ncbi:MAG TPA: hypothetical protein VNE41_05980 [Chitinophagaceae bacterium]|nr:hypothetical protein [Chitinophagaceae bacterium]
MSHIALFKVLPEIATRETRGIILPDKNYQNLPGGEYAFLELYCTDITCDCRNVYFHVIHSRFPEPLACITYGWESLDFYKDWMGRDVVDWMPERFKGPALALAKQSQYAEFWLNIFQDMIKKDLDYAERIIRHYYLFKRTIRENGFKEEN